MRISRREFLRVSSTATAATIVGARAAEARTYRAAVIGRTGGGDYGHGFDTIFAGVSNVTVEAIADVNSKGLEAAAKRSGAKQTYLDFREMLRTVKPDLVSIGPRHPDCHREMALAAFEAGAHILLEKPFTEDLVDADAIVAAAEKLNRKVVVGHKNRYSPEFQRMQRLIAEGFFGTILEMRVQGKQDARAGGEDLIVLGTHDFDLMRFFFGDPLWCFASVMVKGQPATQADVKKGREPMLVAGDTIRATYQFPKNLACTWQSVTAEREWNTIPAGKERWGFIIFGTKRVLSYYSGAPAVYLDTPFVGRAGESTEWKPLPDPKNWPPKPHESHLVRDLIHSIENDSQPICNAADGRWTIEMVSGVYESHRSRRPVTFPLQDRTNPLSRM